MIEMIGISGLRQHAPYRRIPGPALIQLNDSIELQQRDCIHDTIAVLNTDDILREQVDQFCKPVSTPPRIGFRQLVQPCQFGYRAREQLLGAGNDAFDSRLVSEDLRPRLGWLPRQRSTCLFTAP